LISIEHDPEWVETVKKMIQEQHRGNIEYHHIPLDHPEEEPHRESYNPLPKYVDFINQYPDGFFDFVIVDGHYRVACIAATTAKLKPGGILILDNSNWLSLEQWRLPSNFRILHQSSNVKSETTIFLKTSPM
jgi:predicted O-methyltransferase YrrM